MTKEEVFSLSNLDLVSGLKSRVSQEKEIVAQMLYFLAEVQKRRLFFDYGCSSLFQFCMKELGLTEAESGLRISAMKVVLEMPEIREKIAEGSLSLTSVSQARSFFREKIKSNSALEKSEKLDLLKSLENKSTRECERQLIGLLPEKPLPQERTKVITQSHVQISLNISNELMAKLDKIKALLSHKNPNMTHSELLEELANIVLQKLSPTVRAKSTLGKSVKISAAGFSKKEKPEQTKLPRAPSKRSVIREVWIRDQERCTFVDPTTNEKCESRHLLEVDHVHPKALGGEDTLDNLRILCRAHNQWAAIQVFGLEKMTQYIDKDFGGRQ